MVACPAENTWLRYVGGGLEPVSANEIEQHLDGCPSCRFMFANLAAGSDGADPTVPANLMPLALTKSGELLRGAMINRYVILGTLGRGGMGVVYKAFDPELDRRIALKLVAVDGVGADADDSRARLQREAKTLAQLSHPNVVTVHDVGSHDGDVFVAMEFVAGCTLRKWLSVEKRTPREVLAVFRAAGAGLAAAHEVGIVHRDFKPENVIVGDDGRVRVLDFGLARTGERVTTRPSLPSIRSGASTIELTRAGAIMGTPAYMAPEQDLGNEVDGRSDQFSFCASLYEALFGQRAFEGKSYAEIADHRLAGEVRPAPSVRGVSARVRRALLRGMRVDPNERYATMNALLAELAGRRRSVRLAIAALALTSLGAGGWATWVATHRAPSTDEVCATAATEVDRVWNDKRRADLIASLDKLDAHAAGVRAAAVFDRYATDWSARRTGLCKLMMDRTHQFNRDDQTSARLQCLRGRLNTFDALASVLIHAPNQTLIDRSDALVEELAPLEQCDGSDNTPIVNEDTRARWRPLLKELIDGQTALAAGNLDEAERLAKKAVERATASNESEPLAAALLMLGRVRARNGTPARQTKVTLLEAVRAATIGHENGMVVEAWTEYISLAFTDRTMLAELDLPIFSAEVAATRLSERNDRVIEMEYKIGSVQLLRGEIDPALAKLERALAAFKLDPDKQKFHIAAIENSIAVAHIYRGEFAAARTALDRSAATWKSLPFLHPNAAMSTGWYGELAQIQHDFAGAESFYREQLAMFEKVGKAGASMLGKSQFQLGFVLVRQKQCAKARPLLAQARKGFIAKHGEESAFVGLSLLADAHCLLDAGKARKAVALLERATKLATPTPATMLQVPLTEFALARALAATGDKRRAVAAAERARTGFAKYPGARADRETVEAWLAAPR